MKKFSIKSLCVILSILTAIMSLPMTAFALDLSDNTVSEIVEPSSDVLTAQKDIIEMTDMRTASVKYFRLEDGSYYAAQYDSAVHYLDENGDWQDIDNTLAVSGSEITTSNAKIKFAKKTTGNSSLFTLHDGNRKLTLSLDGSAKKVAGEITNHETEFGEDATKLQKMTTLDKINASVLYRDILPGVDLEYVVTGLNIKENIIVKEKSSNYSYSFTMQLNNLTAALNEKGEIIISESSYNEAVYIIPAPVMWDANNVTSDKATMSLTDHGNGKYTLVVTADSDWMNAEERAYPVTIDPPIYTDTNSDVVDLDFHVTSSTNSNTSVSLWVSDTYHAYWQMQNLPELPSGAYIVDAQFSLYSYVDMGLYAYVGAYEVLSDWNATLTYDKVTDSISSQGKTAATPVDFQYVTAPPAWHRWNITSIVRKWYNNPITNFGLALKIISGTELVGIAKFYSNEYSAAALTPKLCITYQDMKGVEDYWSYTSQSAGLAGAGSINNATGKLSFAIPTISTTDHLLPYTPTLVYNGDIKGVMYDENVASVPNADSNAAYGFKLSMRESIMKTVKKDSVGNSVTYYVWADADGTEHYFIPYADNSGNIVYRDEDGLLLKLQISEGSYTITDANQTVRTFNDYGSDESDEIYLLTSITDRYGNKLEFTFNATQRITAISLRPNGGSANVSFTISYNGAGLINRILDPTSQKAVIFYYTSTYDGSPLSTAEGEYLRKVEWAHLKENASTSNWDLYMTSGSNSYIVSDATATYTYDSSGNLISARDNLSQYQVNYTYTGNKVTGVTEVGGTSTTGQSIGLSYYNGYTLVRNSGSDDIYGTADDLVTRYVFDQRGRVSNLYSTDVSGTQIYGAASGEYEQENELAKNSIKTSATVGGASANYLLNGNFEMSSTALTYWTASANVRCSSNHPSSSIGSNSAYFLPKAGVTDTLYQYVYLPEGTYTLSMDIKNYMGEHVSMYVKAISMTNSANSVIKEVPLNEYYASGPSAFFSMPITAHSGGEKYKIMIEVVGGSSLGVSDDINLTVDDIMLEENIGSSDYNLVQFGSFEYHAIDESGNTTVDWSNFWTENEGVYYHETINNGVFGTCMTAIGWYDKTQTFEQTVYTASQNELDEYDYRSGVYLTSERDFLVSGFACGTSQVANPDSHFRITVDVHYYQGSGNSAVVDTYAYDFVRSMTDWQFLSGMFSTREDHLIHKIIVRCEYTGHSGTVKFDSIAVVESQSGDACEYDYDQSTGQVIYKRAGFDQTYYSYDSFGNLKYQMNNDGEFYEYVYDASGKMLEETIYYEHSVLGFPYKSASLANVTRTPKTKSVYGYNNYGQLTSTLTCSAEYNSDKSAVIEKSNTQYLTSTSTYDTSNAHIFGALTSETDSMGRTVKYFYDQAQGYLVAVVGENDDGYFGTAYTYDALGNIVEVNPAQINSSGGYTQATSNTGVEFLINSLNQLACIYTPTTNYYFSYDAFGNVTSIYSWYNKLASYTYIGNNGKISSMQYGNDLIVKYVYDALENVKEVWYNLGGENDVDFQAYAYSYNAYGQLERFDDLLNGQSTIYVYDSGRRMTNMITFDTDEAVNEISTAMRYDEESRLSGISYRMDYQTPTGMRPMDLTYSYNYTSDGRISSLSTPTGSISFTYDSLDRLTTKRSSLRAPNGSSGSFTNTVNYTYRSRTVGNKTYASAEIETYVSQINSNTARTYTYTYDDGGNITKIVDSAGYEYRYVYDSLGQLIREDNSHKNRTYVYTYDAGGNIRSKAEYALLPASTTPTVSYLLNEYTYGYNGGSWGDLMTSYGSTTITYDTIGNPTAIGSATLTWRGRQLMQYVNGSNTYAYTYNDEGIRTSKTINGVKHTYHLSGSQIIAEEWGTNLLVYLYDESGSPIGMMYRNTTYAKDTYDVFFYEKNLQGDIVAVYNDVGTKLISYYYDAWGNVTTTYSNGGASTNAVYNPFKYRGYYQDSETGWYYLQSRYYNPTWGRFINADGYVSTGTGLLGYNMFVYCNNNPVMNVDPTGNMPKWLAWTLSGTAIVAGVIMCATGVGGILGGVLIAAGANSIITGYATEAKGGDFTAGYLGGAISGSLTALGAGGGGLLINAATSTVGSAAALGYMTLGLGVTFLSGFAGNVAGTVVTSALDPNSQLKDINLNKMMYTATVSGLLNIFAGYASGASGILNDMGKASNVFDTQFVCGFMAGTISAASEIIYDVVSYFAEKLAPEG